MRIQRNLNRLNWSSYEEVMPKIRSSGSSLKNPENSREVPVRPNRVDRSSMNRNMKQWTSTGPSKSGGPVLRNQKGDLKDVDRSVKIV